ncbi:outer membrane beta-barrel protein [Flavobacterium silvaticum]|uniref:PorT family protein n=1 Tax=Flavobacterium silvaticum TaxID=1852020 RepID=A0A972FS86_9FLAO|nr:outer membrane beta-barrel protein [Flavobacterium silvaticum]NMH28414.1 PorT family protein [Flavobacterium silvaticum]
MRHLILPIVALFSFNAFSQMDYKDSNRIGIFGGITSFDLQTNDFTNKSGIGWTVGAGIRGNFYNDFDMIYTIGFFESKFSAPIAPVAGFPTQETDFKIQGVQIALMPSYNIVYNHLSIEAGPVFQANSKLGYKKDFENYYMDKLPYTLNDMEKVNSFNFLGAVGFTAGIRELRASFRYMYGFSNFLGKIDQPGANFKSHPSTLVGTLTVFF